MPRGIHPPTRTLRPHPDLAQLKRQAKELLQAFIAGEAEAIAEVNLHYHGAHVNAGAAGVARKSATAAADDHRQTTVGTGAFALHDAQLVLARAYGFESWPKLRAYVDGVTVQRLIDAVRGGEIARVTAMLAARPEIVNFDLAADDEHRALHHAVLQRRPKMVRVLMSHGADARAGIWPHRDATSPLTIAVERGYTEIVDIIREEETRRAAMPETSLDPATDADAATASASVSVSASASASASVEQAALAAQSEEPRPVSAAIAAGRTDVLVSLLEQGFDPDEPERVGGLEEVIPSWGRPLRHCAIANNVAMAKILLAHGANPNTNEYATSSAMSEAYSRQHWDFVRLLEAHGGLVNATTTGYLGLIDRARTLFDDEAAGRLPAAVVTPDHTVAEAMFEGAADGAHVELLRLILAHIDWPPGDPRWHYMLMRPFGAHASSDRDRFVTCFRMMLDRAGIDVRGSLGRTLLHDIAAAWPRSATMGPEDRIAFATILLDRGARLDARDDLLKSTPLGWACRWGRPELVALLLERGADPIEADAEPWATPRAWAERMRHDDVLAILRHHSPRSS